MKKYICFLVLLCGFNNFLELFAQQKFVASVNGKKISKEEFVHRFELTPRINNYSNLDSLKSDFLHTLIAEKLWALEAEDLDFVENKFVTKSVEDIQKKLLREKLYRTEIEEKIKISQDEIANELHRYKKQYLLNFLFSSEKREIDSLYRSLLDGNKIDSLLFSREEYSDQIGGITVLYGQMNRDLENLIFNLKIGAFTEPINFPDGWVIYYVKNISDRNDIGNAEQQNKYISDLLFSTKANQNYSMFFDKYIKGNRVDVDDDIFLTLSSEIASTLQKDSIKYYNKYSKKYFLNFYEIDNIKSGIDTEQLLSDFIHFKNNPENTEEFLDNFSILGFETKFVSDSEVSRALNSFVKDYIFKELLFREARKRGYGNDQKLQKEVAVWKDHFLANYYMNNYTHSIAVNDSEVEKFYDSKINEITDTVITFEVISSSDALLLEQVVTKSNTTQKSFAQVLDMDGSFSDSLLNSSFFEDVMIDYDDPMVLSAFGLKVGEIYGPLKIGSSHQYLRLISKSAIIDKRKYEFGEINDAITKHLFDQKLRKNLEQHTVELAEKYNVNINYPILRSIEVVDVPMFVFRNLGFGEQINAVPYSQDFSNWKNWMPKKLKADVIEVE